MSNSAENHYDILSPYAPQMPKPLPQMLHLAIKNAPEHMKAAISNSLFPAFGSLMHNVGFRYPDNVFHEPHFMCGLIGPMSIGKGSINTIYPKKALKAHILPVWRCIKIAPTSLWR